MHSRFLRLGNHLENEYRRHILGHIYYLNSCWSIFFIHFFKLLIFFKNNQMDSFCIEKHTILYAFQLLILPFDYAFSLLSHILHNVSIEASFVFFFLLLFSPETPDIQAISFNV